MGAKSGGRSATTAAGVVEIASKQAHAPGQPAGPIEVEWQFDALDLRPVERFVAGGAVTIASSSGDVTVDLVAQPAQRLIDTYIDTADWRIGRSGLVLRLRQKRGKHEATVKDTKPAVDGLRKRLEIKEALPSGTLSASAEGGPVSRCVWSLAGERALVPIFGVNTRRRPFEMRIGDDVVGELALDDTTIDVGPGQTPLRLRRVEVEIDTQPSLGAAEANGAPSAEPASLPVAFVERLRRECGLQPASLSKFEAGLLALGVTIPSGQDFGPRALPDAATVGDVAYVAVRRALTTMVEREPGTRLGSDSEELHQMRVATRHMRAVMGIFAPVFPIRGQQLRAEIGWLAAVLGKVRDLDVQLEQLHGWIGEADPVDTAGLDELGRLLHAHWREARVELLAALDSPRYERLVDGLAAMLRSGPSARLAAARASAPESADAIVELQRKAQKAAARARKSGLAADYHQLRIRCKRLRYALEYVSETFHGKVAAYRKQVVTMQTTLGNLQDAEVASTRLRAMAGAGSADGVDGDPATGVQGSGDHDDWPADLSSTAVFVMGRLAERYNEMARQILGELPAQLHLVKGPEWRSLQEYMEDRRLVSRSEVPEPAPVPVPVPPRRVVSTSPAAAARARVGAGGTPRPRMTRAGTTTAKARSRAAAPPAPVRQRATPRARSTATDSPATRSRLRAAPGARAARSADAAVTAPTRRFRRTGGTPSAAQTKPTTPPTRSARSARPAASPAPTRSRTRRAGQ